MKNGREQTKETKNPEIRRLPNGKAK